MTEGVLLERTRRLMFGLSAAMFVATIIELVFAKHTDGLIQLLPFVCCGVGLLMVAVAWKHPDAKRVRILRVVMALIAAASLFGVAEHLWNAYQMTVDFHPGIAGWDLVHTTLTSSIPILAPGALAAGAFVALIATYGASVPHPQPVVQRV